MKQEVELQKQKISKNSIIRYKERIDKNGLRDLQGEKAEIEIGIDKVGITDLILPFKIKTKGGVQDVVARIAVLCSLGPHERGSHMSRMVKVLNSYVGRVITLEEVKKIIANLKKTLEVDRVYIKMEFTLFKRKTAPVTKNYGYVNYNCWISATNNSVSLGTKVLITSLCPVSKAISHASAHNQRGEVIVRAKILDSSVSFEDFVELIEESSSCGLYGVIKREDEKYVTEKAYANPKIVEDIVRLIAAKLEADQRISLWSVSCKNFESIHTHNAYAKIASKGFEDGR